MSFGTKLAVFAVEKIAHGFAPGGVGFTVSNGQSRTVGSGLLGFRRTALGAAVGVTGLVGLQLELLAAEDTGFNRERHWRFFLENDGLQWEFRLCGDLALSLPCHPLLLSFYFLFRKHRLSALLRAAVAGGILVVIGVVQVVLVDQFLTWLDIAYGFDEDAVAHGHGFAIRIAGVVEEHRRAEAVDDFRIAVNAEEIRHRTVGIANIGLALGDARATVFGHSAAARNAVQRVAASCVDVGRPDNETGREVRLGILASITCGKGLEIRGWLACQCCRLIER